MEHPLPGALCTRRKRSTHLIGSSDRAVIAGDFAVLQPQGGRKGSASPRSQSWGRFSPAEAEMVVDATEFQVGRSAAKFSPAQ